MRKLRAAWRPLGAISPLDCGSERRDPEIWRHSQARWDHFVTRVMGPVEERERTTHLSWGLLALPRRRWNSPTGQTRRPQCELLPWTRISLTVLARLARSARRQRAGRRGQRFPKHSGELRRPVSRAMKNLIYSFVGASISLTSFLRPVGAAKAECAAMLTPLQGNRDDANGYRESVWRYRCLGG
jgi:hypothetical protein